MTLPMLLRERRHVLLDFDGPICAVFPGNRGRDACDAMRGLLGRRWRQLPDEVYAADDPFVVLSYFDREERELADAAENALTTQETSTVATAPPTPGALKAIEALQSSGHTVTIVSNNSEAAIWAFLEAQALAGTIDGVVGRRRHRTQDLKPQPYMLTRAIEQRGGRPADAVLLGDSVTDIQAARAAGTAAIAFANKPGKDRALRSFEPDALIMSMHDVTAAT